MLFKTLLAPLLLKQFPVRALKLIPAPKVLSPVPLQQQPISFAAMSTTNSTRGAVISLSHGGGPMPVLGDPGHKEIIRSLKTRVPEILRLNTPERPRAIVVVTAHWLERNPTISNGKRHKLYYDYGGFTPETYRLKYDAPGSPEVAREVGEALKSVGLTPGHDDERGRLAMGGSKTRARSYPHMMFLRLR